MTGSKRDASNGQNPCHLTKRRERKQKSEAAMPEADSHRSLPGDRCTEERKGCERFPQEPSWAQLYSYNFGQFASAIGTSFVEGGFSVGFLKNASTIGHAS